MPFTETQRNLAPPQHAESFKGALDERRSLRQSVARGQRRVEKTGDERSAEASEVDRAQKLVAGIKAPRSKEAIRPRKDEVKPSFLAADESVQFVKVEARRVAHAPAPKSRA